MVVRVGLIVVAVIVQLGIMFLYRYEPMFELPAEGFSFEPLTTLLSLPMAPYGILMMGPFVVG